MKNTSSWILQIVVTICVSSSVYAFSPVHRAINPRLVDKLVPRSQYTSVMNHNIPSGYASQPLWMSSPDGSAEKEEDDDASSKTSPESADKELSRLQKIRQRLFPKNPDDGLTFRQRLAKAGLSVVLSYGWVSNVSYSVTVSLAWYIFSRQTGLSPLAPGEWKSFLAVYAGFWVFNNFVRPIRFAISVGVSAYFDNVIQFMQDKFKVNKGFAIGLTVFFANVVGTLALMSLGIFLASLAAGVPVFPPKA